MGSVVRRSPDFILSGMLAIIALRAALWITKSPETAQFLVSGLLPLWVATELLLLSGTILGVKATIQKSSVTLFGRPLDASLFRLLVLLGSVTIVIEAALWAYGLGAG